MLKKVLVASCLLVTSMASQASLISYNGYVRDSALNIVTGGGLEWLTWDQTANMSINKALSLHAGWRLARDHEMATLLNAFAFKSTPWNLEEDNEDFSYSRYVTPDNNPNDHFIELFGITQSYPCTVLQQSYGQCYKTGIVSQALFGSDKNLNGYYKTVRIAPTGQWLNPGYDEFPDHYEAINWVEWEWWSLEMVSEDAGVALVRDAGVQPSPISLPGSLSLLALGLAAIGFRRRQVLRR